MLAFFIGMYLHYSKLIEAQGANEWLPSGLVLIGQYFPERSIFQITAAIASSFHIAIVLIWYYITKSETSKLPGLICIAGVIRSICLTGIIYIPTPDDHDTHDMCLAGYLLMTAAWFYGMLKFSSGSSRSSSASVLQLEDAYSTTQDSDSEPESLLPRHYKDDIKFKARERLAGNSGSTPTEEDSTVNQPNPEAFIQSSIKKAINDVRRPPTNGYLIRKRVAMAYFFVSILLGHYMIQKRVYRVEGVLSKYAFFEWIAIFLDIAFDAVSVLEFEGLELRVVSLSVDLDLDHDYPGTLENKKSSSSVNDEKILEKSHRHYV